MTENYHQMSRRWYIEGVRWGQSGGDIEDCPYSPEDDGHKDWIEGFADADNWWSPYEKA
jgi:hypothetical protein